MTARATTLPWLALEVAATAAECRSVGDVRDYLLPSLAAATGAEMGIYHQLSWRQDRQEHCVPWPDDNHWVQGLHNYPAVMHHSPIAQHFLAVGVPGVVSLQQLVSAREWHQNPVYVESHRGVGVEDHLAVMLSLSNGGGHAVTLARPSGTFSLEDHTLLAMLAPHLRAALRRCLARPVPYRLISIVPSPTWTWRTGPAITPASDPGGLTSREREVMALTCGGGTSRHVGRILGIAPRTVDKHLEDAFRKLGASCRADALDRLMDQGLDLEAEGVGRGLPRGVSASRSRPRSQELSRG